MRPSLTTTERSLWPLPLLAALLPLVATAIAYALSVRLELVPACNPFFDGCVSISRAGRHGLPNILFRAMLLPAAVLQAMCWMLCPAWLRTLGAPPDRWQRVLPALGVAAGVVLVLYGTFLGTEGEGYRWMRRYGVVFYFGLTAIGALVVSDQMLRRLRAHPRERRIAFAVSAPCMLLPLLGLAHVLLPLWWSSPAAKLALENVTEWWGSAIFIAFFFGLAWAWRKTRFHMELGSRGRAGIVPTPPLSSTKIDMADILVRRDGAIGTLVFSNVEKHNAMTAQMWEALPARIAELDDDADIRVIVLLGDGDKAFVSGADVSQFEAERTASAAQQRYHEIVAAAYEAPALATKPVLAQIRGICMGGGLGLAAACDLRICADDARFRMPAGRLGLGYSQAGVHRFIALLGIQNTYDIFYTARVFDSADALRMGFVSRVVPAAALDETVREIASTIAANAALTMEATKATINAWLRDPADPNDADAQAAIDRANRSEDYREGVRAFAERRTPVFKRR